MDNLTSQSLLTKIAQEKQANTPATAAAEVAALRLHSDASDDIGRTALWAFGLGGAARGGAGIYNLLRRNMVKRKPTAGFVDMPIPYQEEKEASIGDSYFGSPVTDKSNLWYYPSTLAMGGLAAGYGGWKGVDMLLDSRRKGELDDELAAKRKKFRQALVGSYDKPVTSKQAEDEDVEMTKLAADLDALFDSFQKAATFGDVVGKGAGMYTTYAIPTALLAGYAGYKTGSKRQRRVMLEKALLQRKRHRENEQPTPLYATPVPFTGQPNQQF